MKNTSENQNNHEVKEFYATKKELCTEIQNLIKVANACITKEYGDPVFLHGVTEKYGDARFSEEGYSRGGESYFQAFVFTEDINISGDHNFEHIPLSPDVVPLYVKNNKGQHSLNDNEQILFLKNVLQRINDNLKNVENLIEENKNELINITDEYSDLAFYKIEIQNLSTSIHTKIDNIKNNILDSEKNIAEILKEFTKKIDELENKVYRLPYRPIKDKSDYFGKNDFGLKNLREDVKKNSVYTPSNDTAKIMLQNSILELNKNITNVESEILLWEEELKRRELEMQEKNVMYNVSGNFSKNEREYYVIKPDGNIRRPDHTLLDPRDKSGSPEGKRVWNKIEEEELCVVWIYNNGAQLLNVIKNIQGQPTEDQIRTIREMEISFQAPKGSFGFDNEYKEKSDNILEKCELRIRLLNLS